MSESWKRHSAPAAVLIAWPLLVLPGTTASLEAPRLAALAGIVAALSLAAMHAMLKPRAAPWPSPAFLAIAGVWVVWTGCTISWSPVPWDGWLRTATQGMSVAAAFVSIAFLPRETRRPLFAVLSIGGAILASWGLAQYAGWQAPRIPGAGYPDWPFRITATLGDPGLLAHWIACVIPSTAALALTARSAWGKFVWAALLAVQISALAVGFALGAIGALAIGLCACVPAQRRSIAASMRQVTPAAAGLAICCLVLPILFFFVSHPARPVSIPQRASASPAFREDMRTRILVWRSALPMIVDAAPLGTGAGGFGRRYPRYRGRILLSTGEALEPAALDRQSAPVARNDLLHETAETGVPGVLLFLAALGAGLLSTGSRRPRGIGVDEALLRSSAWTGALVGILYSLVGSPFRTTPNSALVWLLLVLAWTPPAVARARRVPRASSFVVLSMIFIAALGSLAFAGRDLAEAVALSRMREALHSGRNDAAARSARRAVALRPDSEALRDLAERLAAEKRYEDADAAYRKLIGRFDEIGLRTGRAGILKARGEMREAASEWEQALALNPHWEPLRLKAIGAAIDAGQVLRARDLLQWFEDRPADDQPEVRRLRERADRATAAFPGRDTPATPPQAHW